MLLLIHIIVALLGLVQAGWTGLSPSRVKINSTYALTTATVASGTVLVVVMRSPITQACGSGLAYLAITLGLAWVAQKRLVTSIEL